MCECKELREEMIRVSSFAHDAKATAEATLAKVNGIEKLLYLWHTEDGGSREKMWNEISPLKAWKAKVLGVVIASVLFASAFGSGVAWVIHYAWNWIVKAVH